MQLIVPQVLNTVVLPDMQLIVPLVLNTVTAAIHVGWDP